MNLSLEEFVEPRSNQVQITIKLDNNQGEDVYLKNVTPQMPEGVGFNTVASPKSFKIISDYNYLCKQVTILFNRETKPYYLFALELIFYMFSKSSFLKSFIILPDSAFVNADQIEISNSEDAKKALGHLQRVYSNPSKIMANLLFNFAYIIQQLESIENNPLFKQPNLNTLVKKDEIVELNYIFACNRNSYTIKKYSLEISVDYAKSSNLTEIINRRASKDFLITPSEANLSLLAVISSIIGATVLILNTGSSNFVAPIQDLSDNYLNSIANYASQLLVSAVIGFLFFNIYEFTDFKDKIKTSIDWRGAIFIGFLSGFFTDRIIDALKVLFKI